MFPNIIGLHKFTIKDQKVILESNGKDSIELDFIRIMDDPKGLLRTKFKLIKFVKGDRIETPVDIFVREFRFANQKFLLSGRVDTLTRSEFSLTLGYQFFQKEFQLTGNISGRSVNIIKRDLVSLAEELINEIYC